MKGCSIPARTIALASVAAQRRRWVAAAALMVLVPGAAVSARAQARKAAGETSPTR